MPYELADQQQVVSSPQAGVFRSSERDDYALNAARSSLTPASVSAFLKQADQGDTDAVFDLYAVIEEDPHVMAVLSKRRRGITSRTLSITPSKLDNDKAQIAADLCNAVVFGDGDTEGIADLGQALYDLTDAIGKGFALGQLVWVNDGKTWRIDRIERWPQKFCKLGDQSNQPVRDPNAVRVLTDDNSTYGEALDLHQWVLHRSHSRSDVTARAALLRSVVFWYLFKHYGIRDWSIFLERLGIPPRIGKYPKNATKAELSVLKKALREFARDSATMIPEDMMVELLEAVRSGGESYKEMIEVCDFAISKAIIGNTLTIESGEKGARSLGEVHADGQLDMIAQDAAQLSQTIRRDILRPIVLFNLGGGYPIPDVEILEEEEQDQKLKAETYEILARSIGLPLSEAHLYDTFEIPPPGPKDIIVKPPVKKTTSDEDITEESEADETAEDQGDETIDDRKLSIASDIMRDAVINSAQEITARIASWVG